MHLLKSVRYYRIQINVHIALSCSGPGSIAKAVASTLTRHSNALYMLSSAWIAGLSATVANCFRGADVVKASATIVIVPATVRARIEAHPFMVIKK